MHLSITRLCLALLFLGALTSPTQAANRRYDRWENAIVSLEITRKQYDYIQPWSRRPLTVVKGGVVIGPNQILTTATDFADRTVVRVQKNGRGSWSNARVTWIDYAANLTLLDVEDPAFFKTLRPLSLARKPPRDGSLHIARWRGGLLEVRKAEFNRFTVSNPNVGQAAHAILELNSEIDAAGAAEAVLEGSELVGFVIGQGSGTCLALPAPFIRSILDARDRGTYRGLGYFDFTWQPTENPETLRYLKVAGSGNGVVIIHVPPGSPTAKVLQARDVLLAVDGFTVDNEGDYTDPMYGPLMLENLSTRNRWAGDTVKLKVWRNGAALDVDYVLPKIADAARLVPEAPVDTPPEYLMVGGLVFQPLTRNYLRSWGQDWERSAPFRLAYFRNEDPTPERPSLLVLSLVLPDIHNLGYHDTRSLVLEKANHRPVSTLPQLVDALAQPVDGFHIFEFIAGETLQRVVLDAAATPESTRRIQERYGIEKDREIR